jgi:hypothetical protein
MAAGEDMLEVAGAYEELAAIAGELAQAVAAEDRASARRPRARRSAWGSLSALLRLVGGKAARRRGGARISDSLSRSNTQLGTDCWGADQTLMTLRAEYACATWA